MAQMLGLCVDHNPGFNISTSHLTTVWAWHDLSELGVPAAGGLGPVHAINIFRDRGIWIKWKQYMTSDSWSRPVLLVPPHQIAEIAAWRPATRTKTFGDASLMLSWLDKLEVGLVDWSGGDHSNDLHELRQIIHGKVPAYSCGPGIDQIIADLGALGSAGARLPMCTIPVMPPDAIVQLFPGGDVPEMPLSAVDHLLKIDRVWEPPPMDLHVLGPGSMVICRAGPTATFHNEKMIFTMGMMANYYYGVYY